MKQEISKAISLYDDLIVLFRLYENVSVEEDEVFQRLFKRYFDIKIEDKVLDTCLFNLLERQKNLDIWFDSTSKLFEELEELNLHYSLNDMIKIATSLIYFSNIKNNHYINESMLRKVNLHPSNQETLNEKENEVSYMYIEFHKAFLKIENDQEFIDFKDELEDEINMMVSDHLAFDLFMKVNSLEKIKEIYQRNKEEQ